MDAEKAEMLAVICQMRRQAIRDIGGHEVLWPFDVLAEVAKLTGDKWRSADDLARAVYRTVHESIVPEYERVADGEG